MAGHRRLFGLFAAIGIVLSATLGFAASAGAAPNAADQFLSDINNLRAQHGLAPLTPDATLDSVATPWTEHMAATETLSHNPALAQQVPNWSWVGENVGYGPTERDLFNAFVASPHHLANLLNPHYTRIGIGVVIDSHGLMWTTHDFDAPKQAAAPVVAPSIAPPPAPTPAPAPPPPPSPSPVTSPAAAALSAATNALNTGPLTAPVPG